MATSSVFPETLEQVESSITEWFGSVATTREIPIKFSRAPKSANRLCFVSHAFHDLKWETKDQCVFFQLQTHKLAVHVAKFLITTAYEDHRLCINFERDPQPELRSLGSALRDAAETKHPVFVSRALRVLKTLEDDLPNTKLAEASAAQTDFGVLLDALLASSLRSDVAEDPLTAAKLRGLKRKQLMLEQAGGTMTSEEVGGMLGISRQGVDKRRGANQLFALTPGKRGYAYPRFQLNENGTTLPGLEEVLRQLQSLDPWMQLIFFTSANEQLGGKTPIKALQGGHLEKVVQATRGFGEQGAS